MIFECVINISEGKDLDLVSQLGDFKSSCVVDIHSDADHNRSVLTLASVDLVDVVSSAQIIYDKALTQLDLESHVGVHPRLGIVDVVPFVSYDQNNLRPTKETIDAAKDFGLWVREQFNIDVLYYDYASENGTTLPMLRKTYSRTGHATCVGAREPLIAINVNIASNDLEFAKTTAKQIRESSGGLKGVRAIGLELVDQQKVQVSMNIFDLAKGNTENACLAVREAATTQGYACEVELVGLVPQFVFSTWTKEFLEFSNLTSQCTIESRLEVLRS